MIMKNSGFKTIAKIKGADNICRGNMNFLQENNAILRKKRRGILYPLAELSKSFQLPYFI